MRYDFNPETNQWETVGEDGDFNFDEFAKFKEASGRARTKMYPGFVLGAEYDIFGNNLLGAGALFTHRKNEYYARTEVALSATVRPIEWFTASLSLVGRQLQEYRRQFLQLVRFRLQFPYGVDKLLRRDGFPHVQGQSAVHTGRAEGVQHHCRPLRSARPLRRTAVTESAERRCRNTVSRVYCTGMSGRGIPAVLSAGSAEAIRMRCAGFPQGIPVPVRR